MGSAIDKLLEDTTSESPRTVDVVNTIRRLAMNKDVRKFIEALNRYSKADWAALMKSFRHAYTVFQSNMLVANDSMLITEMRKYPWLVVFFERVENE